MGLYSRYIFPRILDAVMSGDNFVAVRRKLLEAAEGRILEIGFGTGLNQGHYGVRVRSLVVVEPNLGMLARARVRVSASAPVPRPVAADAGALPFGGQTFDGVVSTWTLCSIPDIDSALREIRRVLRPGGTFHFVEHGRSPDANVRKWQDRLTPLQKRIGDGCHLNRDIADRIVAADLQINALDTYYLPDVPRIGGYLYMGSATRSGSTLEDGSNSINRRTASRSAAEGTPQPG
jgi:SAM-dependent methyltransferase